MGHLIKHVLLKMWLQPLRSNKESEISCEVVAGSSDKVGEVY